MDSPSNVENNKPPIPSDWSDQEDFWKDKAYEKSTAPQCRYLNIPAKQDDNDSDWNDNLYPQNYWAKSQLQIPSRQQPPVWPKGVRPQSLFQTQKIMPTLPNSVKNPWWHKEERDPTVGQKP